MPSFDYTELETLAQELIEEFGTTGTLTKTVNTGTEHSPTRTPANTTIRLVEIRIKERMVDGSLTGKSIRKLLVSTSAGVVPEEKDKITVDGIEHEIAPDGVSTIKPATTDLLYVVSLSR